MGNRYYPKICRGIRMSCYNPELIQDYCKNLETDLAIFSYTLGQDTYYFSVKENAVLHAYESPYTYARNCSVPMGFIKKRLNIVQPIFPLMWGIVS